VQVGDYHYYGWGTHVHHKKAVAHYRTAAESRDAQAYFNLA
jgi:TPR repeat protein